MTRRLIISLIAIISVVSVAARELESGYRGFVEWDNAIGKTYYPSMELPGFKYGGMWFIGGATSHGYQFNDHLYLGAGCMFACSYPTGDMTIPVFADVRFDTTIGRLTPFADLRAGYYYNGGDDGGLYISPTVGYSFRKAGKMSFNLSAGITLRGITKEEYGIRDGALILQSKEHKINTLFTLRFGIEFQ